jgi:hypothetical protein
MLTLRSGAPAQTASLTMSRNRIRNTPPITPSERIRAGLVGREAKSE